jgi:hypothetical protein
MHRSKQWRPAEWRTSLGRMVDSRRTRKASCVFVVTVVAVALAGCTQAPTPEQSAAALPPSLSQLVVGPDGIQNLKIGALVPASTGLVTFGEHTCPSSGGWIVDYPQDVRTSSGQALDPFDIVTVDASKSGRIAREFVWSKQIRTARGISVGSSMAAVTAAYPSAKRSTSYSTVLYAVAGAAGTLVIEVAGHNANAAGEWPAATLGTVVWMQVIERGAKVESIANNNDAGPCPDKGEVPDDD